MNGKVFFKNILLFLVVFVSFFFFYVTDLNLIKIGINGIMLQDIFTIFTLLLPFTVGGQIIFLLKKSKKVNIAFMIYHIVIFFLIIFKIIKETILVGDFDYDWLSLLYVMVIFSYFVFSMVIKKKDSWYDNLVILFCLFVLFIFSRFYLDQNFLHNIFHDGYINNGNEFYLDYVRQYYFCFIVGYITIFVGEILENIS